MLLCCQGHSIDVVHARTSLAVEVPMHTVDIRQVSLGGLASGGVCEELAP